MCCTRQVKKHVSESQRREISSLVASTQHLERSIQRQEAAAAASRQPRRAGGGGGNEVDDERLEAERHELEQQKDRLDELIGKECPLTGEIALRSLHTPLWGDLGSPFDW